MLLLSQSPNRKKGWGETKLVLGSRLQGCPAEDKGNRASLSFAEVGDACLLRGSSVAGGGREERSHPCLL